MSIDRIVSQGYANIQSIPHTMKTILISKQITLKTSVTNIICSGGVYAMFDLKKNNDIIATKRSGPKRNVDFVFPFGLTFDVNDWLIVEVTHYRADVLPDFECGVFGAN